MIVYLNGRFLHEAEASISVHDRGFLYGDGIFETIRCYAGEPFLWREHFARFQRGCELLRLKCSFSEGEIREVIQVTLSRNQLQDALVRVTMTRGTGPRGYSPKGADNPTFLVAAFPSPQPPATCRVIVSTVPLPDVDPLAEIKHLNKLPQILARAEADSVGAFEALLTNGKGCVVEASSANLFWVKDKRVMTSPLIGVLGGTTRAHVLRLCAQLKINTAEQDLPVSEINNVDGLFLTSCAAEIMEITEVAGRIIKRSPLVQELRSNYRKA